MENLIQLPKETDFLKIKMFDHNFDDNGEVIEYKGTVRLDQVLHYHENYIYIKDDIPTRGDTEDMIEYVNRVKKWEKTKVPDKKIVGTTIIYWQSGMQVFIPIRIDLFEDLYFDYLSKKHQAL